MINTRAKKGTGALYAKLIEYKEPKASEKEPTYIEECSKCGKEFTFKESELNMKVIKCPYCGYEVGVFFKYNYN